MNISITRTSGGYLKLLLLGLFMGKSIYIITSVVSPTNILFPFLILLTFFSLSRERINHQYSLLLVNTWCLPVIQAVHIVLGNSGDFQSLYYLLYLSVLTTFILMQDRVQIKPFDFFVFLKYGLYISFIISILQFVQVFGIFSQLSFLIESKILGDDSFVLLTGGFTNPNNLAVIWLMSFAYLYVWVLNRDIIDSKFTKSDFATCYTLTAIILLLTMSRLCIGMFFLFSTIIVLKKKPILLLFSPLVIIMILNLELLMGITPLLDHNISKLQGLVEALSTILNSSGSNSSGGIRTTIYGYTLENIFPAFIGSGLGNYNDFYSPLINSNADNNFNITFHFLKTAPHSLILESILAFGWLGGLFIILLFYSVFSMQHKKSLRGKYEVFLLFLAVTFIPSSVFRMPLFFFLLLGTSFINFKFRAVFNQQVKL